MSTLSKLGLGFEKDPRRQQEIRLRPVADRLYRKVFGEGTIICRFDRDADLVLDKQFAIDVQIGLPGGMLLLGQEKFLSYKFAKYATVTVEYEQNQHTGERGDWFRLSSQFYFVGYAANDERSFDPWILLNWPAVVIATHTGKLLWGTHVNRDGRALASFKYCRMADIPVNCIIATS